MKKLQKHYLLPVFCLALACFLCQAPFTSFAAMGDNFTPGSPVSIQSITQDFYADRTEYRITGRVTGRFSGGPEVKIFQTTVIWFPETKSVQEETTVIGSGETGSLMARCPTDPVIYSDHCTGASFNGIYADPVLENIKGQLISRNILTEEQKASLRSQSEAAFPPPVILKPTPNEVYGDAYRSTGDKSKFRVPVILMTQYEADINLEIKKYASSSFSGSVQSTMMGFKSESAETGPNGTVFQPQIELEPGFYKIIASVVGVESAPVKSSEQVQFSVLGSVDAAQLGKILAEDTALELPIERDKALVDTPVGLDPQKTSDAVAKDLKEEDLLAARGTRVFIKVPIPNQVYNTFIQGNVQFNYLLEAPYPSPVEFVIKKDSKVFLPPDTLSGEKLYSGSKQLPPGKYTIEARLKIELPSGSSSIDAAPKQLSAESWGNPVTFYLGMEAALKDSASVAAASEITQRSGEQPESAAVTAKKSLESGTDKAFNPQPEPPAKFQAMIAPVNDNPADQKQSDITQRNGDRPPPVDIKENLPLNRTEVVQKTPQTSPPKQLRPIDFSTISPVEGRTYNAAMPVFIKAISPGQTEIEFKITRLPGPGENYQGKVVESWFVEEMQQAESGNFVYEIAKRLPPGQYLLAVGVQDDNLLNYSDLPHRRFSVVTEPLPIERSAAATSGQEKMVPGKTGTVASSSGTDRSSPTLAQPSRKSIDPGDDGRSAPTPLALPRGAAFSVNSLASLPVKHVAGQKPVYEFEYYDGRAWRKERSIRPISMQTPQGSGMTQVITKTSFRISKPGKYRYRVKTDASGSPSSPYQEFVVVDPRAQSMAQVSAQAQASRAKAAAEPAAAGAPAGAVNIAKSPARTEGPRPPDNSADLQRGTDTATPQVPAQRQLMPPSAPPRITAPRPNQAFSAPANVIVQTSHDARFELVFEISMGAGKPLMGNNGDFRQLAPGKYLVKVGYKGRPQRSQVDFWVHPKKQAVQAQPQPQKAPAAQPAPRLATPPPIRRSVSPQ